LQGLQTVKTPGVIEALLRIATFVVAVPHVLAFAMFVGAVDRIDAIRALMALMCFLVLAFAPRRVLRGWLMLVAALSVAAISTWEIITALGDASGIAWGSVAGLATGLSWLAYLIWNRSSSTR
jgi:hypothetical protein